jgi:glucose/arabinose dehydrogenase
LIAGVSTAFALPDGPYGDTQAPDFHLAVSSQAFSQYEAAKSPSLLIIDRAIGQLDFIVDNVPPHIAIAYIDVESDGIDSISHVLQDFAQIQSLYIISHGRPGSISLGSTLVDSLLVRDREADVRSWANSLAPGADVILYGCEVSGDGGVEFVSLLSKVLNADVAASTTPTGSQDQGGDWDLEYATGPIEAPSVIDSKVMQASGILLAIPAGFTDELVLDNLSQPVALTVLPTGEMLVLQRQGKILLTNPAANQPVATTYLQLPNVDSNGEKGLLSIALDPNFPVNHYFYVYYHNKTVDRARVSRFIHDTDRAHASDEFIIWEDNLPTALQIVSDHWGGGFGFGPDRFLYLAVGDKSDVPADSQNLNLTAGKILRLNTAGADSGLGQWTQGASNSHLIPANNPFIDGPGGVPDEIWAIGLRNPFRAYWDLIRQRFYIGEVGGNIQSGADASHEDIHVVTTADGGVNFGWPNCEGPDCVGAPPANYSPPLYSIQHTDSRSIVVGPVYRGNLFPSEYNNALFIADSTKGWLRYLTFDAAGNVSPSMPTGGFRFSGNDDLGAPVALEVGADDALYYLDIVGRNASGGGQLRRITYNSNNPPPVISQASANPTSSPNAPLVVLFTGVASDPAGQAITYNWDFGDGTQANAAIVSHTYTTKGSYNAVLRVSDNLRTTTSDPVLIRVGSPPVTSIAQPTNGALFRAGETVVLRGSGTDADSVLTSSSFRWTVRFGHDSHFHPVLSDVAGTPCAPGNSVCLNFSIPGSGHDFTDNTRYEITLSATDSDGISGSSVISIFPDKSNLTFTSNVPGNVTFFVDGIPRNGPFVLDTLIGFQHTIGAPSSVVADGNLYEFSSWANGPATPVRTITVPATNQTYTANYNNAGPYTGPAAYLQSNGSVVMEAEHFDANVSSGGTWSPISPAGASGTAMQAGSGGRLEYQINFSQTGTHYVYVRSFGANGKSNSAFVGIDGAWTGSYFQVSPYGSWEWEGPIAINVASAGVHTVGLTIRETGTQVDKVVILKTAVLPTGTGPPESPRAP